jgi:hypothetical protein
MAMRNSYLIGQAEQGNFFSSLIERMLWPTRENPIDTVNEEITLGNENSLVGLPPPIVMSFKPENWS